jgi:hypothetical protein
MPLADNARSKHLPLLISIMNKSLQMEGIGDRVVITKCSVKELFFRETKSAALTPKCQQLLLGRVGA